MAYVSPNYSTKKGLKDGLVLGDRITVYQPALGTVPQDGKVLLEGPHYPKPHTWYAIGTMKGGKLVAAE